MSVTIGDVIVCWFSCGAASAVAAKKTLEKYGAIATVRVVNNPVIEEDEDNRRFLSDVENWLGVKIETAVNKNYLSCSAVEVWNKRKYMSGVAGAPCTLELKKMARRQFEDENRIDWHVLGFTNDEKKRFDRFVNGERANTLPILIEAGLSKQDCFRIIQDAGIELPRVYSMGYTNANCIGCVKATSPKYWNLVRECHPDVFAARAEQSKRIGAKLVRVRGERVFLNDLEPDVNDGILGLDFDCGIFCEEREPIEKAGAE